jgi:hypothetical protein
MYCEMHLMSTPDWFIVHEDHEGMKGQLKNVIKRPWKSDESLKQIWELSKEIQNGQAPGSRLICLDLEYSAASRKVFEVGICEYVSGRTIVNSRIRHDCTFEELVRNSPSRDVTPISYFKELIGKLSALRVYGTNGPGGKNKINAAIRPIHLSTVHQVAEVLRRANVTPDTTVITWARNRTDLVLLRDFLEAAGHTDIMPLDQNCFRPLVYYDRNLHALPNGKRLPLKLDIIFPLLFPRHALIGKNHRALVDAQQLRLVTMKLEEFCFGKRYLQQNRFSMKQPAIEDWIKPTSGRIRPKNESKDRK